MHSLVPLISLWLVASHLHSFANAYPDLFVSGYANGCTDHPSKGYADHGSPLADRTTTFTLTPAGSSAAVAALCPGVPYSLAVSYGTVRRRALITASAGTFASGNDKACPNRAVSQGSSATYTNTFTLPCSGAGKGPVLLKVTSAGGASDNFHNSQASFAVQPLAECPASTCPGAPKAAAAATPAAAAAAAAAKAPAAAAVAKPVTAAEPAAAPAAATAARSIGGQHGSGCDPSPYGYACRVPAGSGATLHFTRGGPTPPDNPCTAAAAKSVITTENDNEPIHFLLEAPVGGYVGLGFPGTAGKMVPSDAVIGYVDKASGQPKVSAYHLDDYSPSTSPTNFNGAGWASNMGAARPTAGNTDSTLLCLTRLTNAPQAAVVKQLDLAALDLNWAGDDSTSFVTHSTQQSLTVNLADGSAAVSAAASPGSKLSAQLAHGALMLLAFVVFMPLGALTARHKWLFGNKQVGGLGAGWFHLHRACQCLAVLLALVGFIIGVVVFDVSWDLADPIPHPLYDVHRFLGVVVIIFMVLQALAGFVRPNLSTRYRPMWRFGHLSLGWLTLALGTMVVFVGVVLMHGLARQPWVNWLMPVVLLLGLIVLLGLLAEAFKFKLERSGRYVAAAHKFGDPSSHAGKRPITPKAQISSSDAENGASSGLNPGNQT